MGHAEGKVALVTGAARGQGAAHAVRLAAEGADIIAVDMCQPAGSVASPPGTPDDLAQTASLVRALGRRVLARPADVRRLDQLTRVVDEGVTAFGRLDIIGRVHHRCRPRAGQEPCPPARRGRGRHHRDRPVRPASLSAVPAGHGRGPSRDRPDGRGTGQAAIPYLIAGGRGGAIVATSSVAGLKSYPNMAHYVAAKHGVTGLARALAIELAPHRIRVNSVHPTQVDTDMIQNDVMYRLFRPDLDSPGRADFAEASRATGLLPVDWVEADDVSSAVLFLASDDGRYVTGTALAVDAGALIA